MRRNISRQTLGEMAMFLPPGHSSPVKSIGQFSIPIFTPHPSACSMIAGQRMSKTFQLSSTLLAGSRPTKVLTLAKPSLCAA
jgi:hypothetical protein